MPTFGDLTNVSVEKLQELNTVLARILALPLARDTYAQIIDGKPTRNLYPENPEGSKTSQSGSGKGSSADGNSEPTDRPMEEYEKIRKAFTPANLLIDLNLAQHYQNAPSGSRENMLRLLQIAAASVNALARKTYLDFHPGINIKPPKPPEGHHYHLMATGGGFYVNFYHTSYREFERYPFGLLDVVGYWAEAELFGGLLLFERDGSGSNIINAFLHPQRASRTFQLSENQVERFAGLIEVDDSAETVIPFTREADARTEPTWVRVGEAPLRIYKNEYDKLAVAHWPVRSSCVVKAGDPGAASFDNAMKIIKENGWDKIDPRTAWPEEEASSSSNDDPPSAKKMDL